MGEQIIFSPGTFFHGTKADLKTGDLLTNGFPSNYKKAEPRNTYILQVHWMPLYGVLSWRQETESKEFMLWSRRENLKMTLM